MPEPTDHTELAQTLRYAADQIEQAAADEHMNADTAVELGLGVIGQVITEQYGSTGLRRLLRHTDDHDWAADPSPLRYPLGDRYEGFRDAVRGTTVGA